MNSRNSPNEYPQQCPWVMRVGVFFDGTGNNKENDLPRDKASNIAKLSEIYVDEKIKEKLKHYKMVYENGVGTIDGVDEVDYELSGLALGDGAIQRIHRAIKKVAEFFDERPCAKEFIVDVFGFSRGAAQARHFVNEIHDRAAGPNVKIGFVGLYDTVASFVDGWAGALGFKKDRAGDNINNAEWEVKAGTRTVRRGSREVEVPYYQTMIQSFNFHLNAASADYVEHFTARDEVRKNFPLSSLLPHDGGGIKQQEFIGVHSDIGGGYAEDEGDYENKLVRIGHIRLNTSGRTSLAMQRRLIQTGEYTKRYYYDAEAIERFKQKGIAAGYSITEETRGRSIWLVGRKRVKKRLANVYLNLMHMRATMAGVPLEPLLSDEEHNIPVDLNDYAMSLINSESFGSDEELHLYANYVHQSDVDPEDRSPIFKIKSYFGDLANEPSEGHIRTVFDNDAHKAVDPTANDKPDAYGAEINTENLSV
ncbi:MAG: DUF2235 domain-containing protein [Kangiella sp.]|nr:DUF2235 domain-containing protein [Kangiella sp.]